MKVIIIKSKTTNCYLIQSSCGWIIVDAGWPDTLHQFLNILKQEHVHINDIKYLIITHFHPDHAGLTENLKDFGINLILHESQVIFVDKLNTFFKRNPKINFKDIEIRNSRIVSSACSRIFLKSVGIDGEIVQTPGHSEDSISLIIDDCCAFTGDLPGLSVMELYDDQTIKDSWKLIQSYNVKKIYPAHGEVYTV